MEVLFIAPFINNIIPSYTCAYNRMDVIVWKRDSSVHFLEYYNNAVMDGPILSLLSFYHYSNALPTFSIKYSNERIYVDIVK